MTAPAKVAYADPPADTAAWRELRDDHPELHAAYQAWRARHDLGVDPLTFRGEFSREAFLWAAGWIERASQ